jgi:hypothetical protein
MYVRPMMNGGAQDNDPIQEFDKEGRLVHVISFVK